jgi:uncharacterized protein YndB with AHSA1/START domain
MPDIKHSIVINAPAGSLHSLVSSAAGFARWWAADSIELDGGAAELGFFHRNTVYRLRPELKAPNDVVWRCETGREWSGTVVRFQLEPSGQGTQLRFLHGGWQAETDYFIACNTTWGGLMYRLKDAAEGATACPLFT